MRVAIFLSLSILLVAAHGYAQGYKPPPPESYEAQALSYALKLRKLRVDPHPMGKRVRKLHVVTLRVFSKRDRWLQFFNIFHWRTKEYIIEQEIVLRPGKMWDPERVKETERRLRDPLFTSLVVSAPVQSPEPGTVDYLVVTRDMWSLRLNSNFEVQSDSATGDSVLSLLLIAPSENNVFGYRKQAALVFDMDLGKYLIGPRYVDKNIAGTRLTLSARASAIFNRKTDKLEGSTSAAVLQYPFWRLSTRWSGGISLSQFNGVVRLFQGLDIYTFENPDTGNTLPYEYRLRQLNIEPSAARAFGHKLIHRVRVGYRFASTRASVLDDFPSTNPRDRDALLPRSERVSAPFLRYSLFTPEYRRYRNINTYDLAEDFQIGPSFQAEASYGSKVLGSENEHVALSSTLQWRADIGGGYAVASAGGYGRVQDGSLIDRRLELSAKVVGPEWFGLARLVGRIGYSGRFHETQNRFFQLGGSSGLRGYEIGAFSGTKRVLGNLELRTRPWRVWFSRVGGVAFWDGGGTADHLGDLRFSNDVGLGLRALLPQLSPLVYRLDMAFPLNGGTAGQPRFFLSFGQVF